MRNSSYFTLSAAVVVGLAATVLPAKPAPVSGTPSVVKTMLDCRAIRDSAQRLACFDAGIAAVDQAIASKELVLIDKAKASAAKRSLFGYSVPDFAGLLGGGDLQQIESTVTGVGSNADGGYTVRLADGSSWTQNDDTPIALPPRKGDKVVVKRATLGAYFLRIGSQPGVKVHRIN